MDTFEEQYTHFNETSAQVRDINSLIDNYREVRGLLHLDNDTIVRHLVESELARLYLQNLVRQGSLEMVEEPEDEKKLPHDFEWANYQDEILAKGKIDPSQFDPSKRVPRNVSGKSLSEIIEDTSKVMGDLIDGRRSTEISEGKSPPRSKS